MPQNRSRSVSLSLPASTASFPSPSPTSSPAPLSTAASKWHSIRPWAPPALPPLGQLPQLRLVDLTPTSLALALCLPSPSPISIQLDSVPWPHVAEGEAGERGETSLVVFGLEEGRGYDIRLEVLGDEAVPSSVDGGGVTTPVREDEVEQDAEPEVDDGQDSPAHHSDAPPPYTPVPSPAPSPTALRTLLKTLRTTSKRNETSLLSSISAVRKAVEKGLKEDQRSRTRIVSLEEGIRKAEEGEASAREGGEEREEVEARINDLEVELEEWESLLKSRREVGTSIASGKKDEDDTTGTGKVGELGRELESMVKALEEKETQRKEGKDRLRALEVELGNIEGELLQIEREETHRTHLLSTLYNVGNSYHPHHQNRSSSSLHSLGSIPPVIPPQNVAPNSSSAFNIKWSRGPRAPGSRFWKRNTAPTQAQVDAQSYAVEQQNLWARGGGQVSPSAGSDNVDTASGGLDIAGRGDAPPDEGEKLVVGSAGRNWGGFLGLGPK